MKLSLKELYPQYNRLATSRWVALVLPFALLALLLAVLLHLLGAFPALVPISHGTHVEIEDVPLNRAETLFAVEAWKQSVPTTNLASSFYTLHFKPPPQPDPPPPKPVPPPPVPPPPPPPTNKKVMVVYQGLIESANGFKKAFIKAGDQQIIGTNGIKVIGGYTLSDFALRSATLINTNGSNNVLNFNVPKEIEIPPQ